MGITAWSTRVERLGAMKLPRPTAPSSVRASASEKCVAGEAGLTGQSRVPVRSRSRPDAGRAPPGAVALCADHAADGHLIRVIQEGETVRAQPV